MVKEIAKLFEIDGGWETLSKVKDNFSNFIVRPLNSFGLAGFVFDVEDETTINMQAEITDHYTESNSAIQDHIAIKPDKITLRQYVGEVVYRKEGQGQTSLQNLSRKLTIVNNYLPKLTQGGEQIANFFKDNKNINFSSLKNSVSNIDGKTFAAGASKLADLWGGIKNLNPPISKQQQAFMFFEALFKQKILVSVQTPFKFYTNMAIESIVARQDGESQFISDFSITLKEFRVAETKIKKYEGEKYDASNAQDRSEYQKAPTIPAARGQGVKISERIPDIVELADPDILTASEYEKKELDELLNFNFQ